MMEELRKALGMDEDEFAQFMKTRDEVVDYPAPTRSSYYVLKEEEPVAGERIHIKSLQPLPVAQIRRNELNKLSKEAQYIEVTDDFYPDLIEENGVHFVSISLWEQMQEKFDVGEIEYNLLGSSPKAETVWKSMC